MAWICTWDEHTGHVLGLEFDDVAWLEEIRGGRKRFEPPRVRAAADIDDCHPHAFTIDNRSALLVVHKEEEQLDHLTVKQAAALFTCRNMKTIGMDVIAFLRAFKLPSGRIKAGHDARLLHFEVFNGVMKI